MGTNSRASQAEMLALGTRRDIYDLKLTLQPLDNSIISLQMEPVIHKRSQGTGTNGWEISDSDYEAEYPDDYHGEFPDDYAREYQYGDDQGIDY
ncbi:Calponin-3 [Cricetulus griseus]|uniref:Calponin-3 n=1 Tax=Cricetulus griseus TaxID=10029 RepID=G3ID23_CRIGR|nr:Calponin-3 [Cricetulus griseus]ERE65892.1 calponin-3-like protein [Cricetulus griseus]